MVIYVLWRRCVKIKEKCLNSLDYQDSKRVDLNLIELVLHRKQGNVLVLELLVDENDESR